MACRPVRIGGSRIHRVGIDSGNQAVYRHSGHPRTRGSVYNCRNDAPRRMANRHGKHTRRRRCVGPVDGDARKPDTSGQRGSRTATDTKTISDHAVPLDQWCGSRRADTLGHGHDIQRTLHWLLALDRISRPRRRGLVERGVESASDARRISARYQVLDNDLATKRRKQLAVDDSPRIPTTMGSRAAKAAAAGRFERGFVCLCRRVRGWLTMRDVSHGLTPMATCSNRVRGCGVTAA